MMNKPYAPDIGHPYPGGPKPGGNNGGGHGGGRGGGQKWATMGGFIPGQISSIAEDLASGYGGETDEMKDYLRDVYSPVKIPQFNFGGGNGNGGKGKGKGGGKGDPTKPGNNPNGTGTTGGFDPSRPDHRMAQAMPMARPMIGQPAMAQGFLAPPQQQMQSAPMQQGFLGAQPVGDMGQIQGPARLPPEILAMMQRR